MRSIVPYQAFNTKDGDMVLAIGNDSQFASFSKLLDKNWHKDPDFQTNAARVINREKLIAEIKDIMMSKTTDAWVALLEENTIPCGPVNNLAQILSDPHIVERGLVGEIDEVPIIKNPINYSKTPMEYKKAPPKLKP